MLISVGLFQSILINKYFRIFNVYIKSLRQKENWKNLITSSKEVHMADFYLWRLSAQGLWGTPEGMKERTEAWLEIKLFRRLLRFDVQACCNNIFWQSEIWCSPALFNILWWSLMKLLYCFLWRTNLMRLVSKLSCTRNFW